jgi:hypothetical protein
VALTEIYLKLAVAFPTDPKVRALARFGAPDAGLARDLYVQMCLHCKEYLTDGFVPDEQVGLLVYPLDAEHGKQLAKQLASVGLTKELSKNGASGWQVLAYVPRNGTREDVQRLAEVRANAGRTGGRKSRKNRERPRQTTTQANSKQVANQVGKQVGQQKVSNPVSVSVVPNGPTDTDPQTPTASAANGLTPTQRSKPITDAYAKAQPMCRWPAINGVVIHAIKSGKYGDSEIRSALLRLAESGQSVTVETLRIELEGFTPPRGRHSAQSTTDQRMAAIQALKAPPGSQPENVIPGSVIT